MIQTRKSKERGFADHGWLKSAHTFSFADYYDPQFMGFSVLRVINEDWVEANQGFGTHPHHDMEIITYVIEGELEHKDSMGNGSVIRPGEVQQMSAGTGVTHSEFNPSKSAQVHLLQIWIQPDKKGMSPRYAQKDFSNALKSGKLNLLASPDGRNESIPIHQNAFLYAARIKKNDEIKHSFSLDRRGWIQLVKGECSLSDQWLKEGDGCRIENERDILLIAKTDVCEFLLFDLP